ncbi:MAG: tRNA lysidine(34) synthetase TilS, partial [Gallionella sp.]
LLRGSGVRGAASMPVLTRHGTGPVYIRPLLHQSRSEILSYATEQGLKWIDDESNADDYFPRNYLRHRVLPVLEKKFPAYRETLTRGTQHFAEASQLLDELAQMDGERAMGSGALRLASLRQLSHTRAKNLLRYFLYSRGAHMPQLTQLNEMLRQLCDARQDASVNLQAGEFQIRRYMDSAYIVPAAFEFDRGYSRIWNGEDMLYWPPQRKQLHFSRGRGAGVSLSKLQGATLTLKLRGGKETIRPHAAASRRSLRNLLQQQHIPPWQRERIPLLYCGDVLVAVVGVAIDAAYQAQVDEVGLLVSGE